MTDGSLGLQLFFGSLFVLAFLSYLITKKFLVQSFEGSVWYSTIIFMVTMVCSVALLELLVLEAVKSGDVQLRLFIWKVLLSILNTLTLLVTPCLLISRAIRSLKLPSKS
jgi:hypothetical protein